MTLRCVADWRNFSHSFQFGEVVTLRTVHEDDLNFYALGVCSVTAPGISSNFLTLPKHSFRATDAHNG